MERRSLGKLPSQRTWGDWSAAERGLCLLGIGLVLGLGAWFIGNRSERNRLAEQHAAELEAERVESRERSERLRQQYGTDNEADIMSIVLLATQLTRSEVLEAERAARLEAEREAVTEVAGQTATK